MNKVIFTSSGLHILCWLFHGCVSWGEAAFNFFSSDIVWLQLLNTWRLISATSSPRGEWLKRLVHTCPCPDSSAALCPIISHAAHQDFFFNAGGLFLTSPAQKKTLFNSPHFPHGAHNASSSSHFNPYGNQEKEVKYTRRRRSQLFVGLQSWFGERPTISCYVSLQAAIIGLFWVDPYALKPSLIITCGLWAACVIDLHAPGAAATRCDWSFAFADKQQGDTSHTLCVIFTLPLQAAGPGR